ncbi:MAG: hypothetical protein GWP91_22480 [Rhodobacterales bacterium]|nr:hypothetical protein [Rhodobacterales bacterium]
MGAILSLNISIIALGTFGLGIICYACMAVPVIQFFFGVGETSIGYRAMNGERLSSTHMMAILGIVVAALTMAVIPRVLEIFTLINLNDDEVDAWLEGGDAQITGAA